MTSEERKTHAAWLMDLGVPVAFHDAIIGAPKDWLADGDTAPMIVMLAGTIGVTAAAFFGLDAWGQARAAAAAAQTGALLVYTSFIGFGLLALLMGMEELTRWACSMFAARYRVNGFLSAAAAKLKPQPLLARWGARRQLSGPVRRAAAASTTVDDFLCRMALDGARAQGIAAAVLLPLAIILMAQDTNFWVAGSAGIVEQSMAPFSSRHHDLDDVAAITTGCNHANDGEVLIYDLVLPSGQTFHLGTSMTKAVSGSKLAAIETIDAQIRRIGNSVEHRRWWAPDRDPVDARCLARWARQFDSDGEGRLTRLLHLTAGEARKLPAATRDR